ncbi:DUF914-domain-containing protein [Rhizopus microsporus]|uniref:DUF914-domain-containing protein n=1 Tax=Rhizopus microsporus TaxID=58291 RepID=A0A1X0SH01_RHIZD|nr:DUF914-domain-containing protein [Rhizopus microsporus]
MRSRRQIVLPVFLGQLLSLCIVGTSTASSALWNHYGISIPCTQNFCNYLLLAIIYGNVLAVLAFKSTSLLSALVLSSWTIPCVMLLSTYFLHAKYSLIHVRSAVICLVGLALLIWCDTMATDDATANHSWIGDIICLMSATSYAVCNVIEEHLVSHHTTAEILGKAGLLGSLLCGMQALYFEYDTVISIQWTLGSGYILCLFTMYSLVPTVYRMTSATFVNMNLITNNFYSLLVGLFFLNAKMPPFYLVAYVLVITGVISYSLAPSTTDNDSEEHRQILKSPDHSITSYT